MKNFSPKILIKNFTAGKKALWDRILIYGGSAIAIFQFFDFILEKEATVKLLEKIPYFNIYIKPLMSNVFIYLFVAIALAFFAQSSFTNYSKKIKGRDIRICVKVGDIFDSPDGIIVPSNNTFLHSQRENDKLVIGDKSIQAQIVQKCESQKYTTKTSIDDQITEKLNTIPTIYAAKLPIPPITVGNEARDRYAYGTIVPVTAFSGKKQNQRTEKHFYFLAMSEIETANNPTTNDFDLTKSIETMWKNIRNLSIEESITCPVLATGAAKYFDKPAEIVARYILKSFANYAVSKNARVKEFTLIIRPKDYLENKYNLEELHKYVDFLCRFPNDETELIKEKQSEI